MLISLQIFDFELTDDFIAVEDLITLLKANKLVLEY